MLRIGWPNWTGIRTDGILTWHPNRLSRNSIDSGQIIHLMDLGKLQEVRTPGQVFRNNPNDKFLLNLLCSQAKLENDNKIVDIKRGLKRKVEMGWFPCLAPLGYLNTPTLEKGKKYLRKDPRRFNLVRKIFDLVLSQKMTPPKAFKIATEQWGLRNRKGKQLALSTLYKILSDTFYYGLFEYPKGSGNWYQGKHPPVITIEEYDQIQTILGIKGAKREKTHSFAFSGLMRCGECGAMVTAEDRIKRQKNGNVHTYVYYHCTKKKKPNCSQKYIEVKQLEKQITEKLESISIPSDFQKWVIEKSLAQENINIQDYQTIRERQQEAYGRCVLRMKRLIDMRTDEEISAEEFLKRKNELLQEKKRLREALDNSDKKKTVKHDPIEKLYSFAGKVLETFLKPNPHTRRAILASLGSNLTLKDRKLDISLAKELLPLQTISSEVRRIHKGFEPTKVSINKEILENSYPLNLVLSCTMEEVRTYAATSDKYKELPVFPSDEDELSDRK